MAERLADRDVCGGCGGHFFHAGAMGADHPGHNIKDPSLHAAFCETPPPPLGPIQQTLFGPEAKPLLCPHGATLCRDCGWVPATEAGVGR